MSDLVFTLLIFLFWGFVLIGLPILLVVRSRREKARRQAEFQEVLEQQHTKEALAAEEQATSDLAGAWLAIKKSYPFLSTPRLENPTEEAIVEAARDALYKYGTLGRDLEKSLPAPLLPLGARTRHLYVIGKTGSGKSTYLEHLIASDLENGWSFGVMSPEGDLFLDRLLPIIPPERWEDVIYFAPGDPRCPHTFNPLALSPGEDPNRTAEDLFTILRRVFREDELGPRMAPLLQNSLATIVGRPGMTLLHLKQLLEDEEFRDEIVADTTDEYTRSFWENTYPRFSRDADLPIQNRLNRFLRSPETRRVLCSPESTFSIRDILDSGKLFFVNLYGLSQENRELFGQLLLSKFQIELMRRELGGSKHRKYLLYADEFQSFAGVATDTWRELLSRGRKYGLGLVLAHQYPSQLPKPLQEEILGNAYSILSFSLGAKDAAVIRRELLRPGKDGELEPIASSDLLDLPTGRAIVKLAGGHATPISFPPPYTVPALAGNAFLATHWGELQQHSPTTTDPQDGSAEPSPREEPDEWRG